VAEEDPQHSIRHSSAFDAELISDPAEKAAREARNALLQIDEVVAMVEGHLENRRSFRLRVSTLLHLHRMALEGISAYAGNFRPAGIEIGGSKHKPIGAHLVAAAVEEMCDYVNENWQSSSALHLAAYALWKLNWIHPFTDGNGRTARAVSYLILCLKIEQPIYGRNTVPEQIAANKKPYYDALEKCDAAWSKEGQVSVGALEELLESLFARQLLTILNDARSNKD
jgi:Fic family protein